MKLQTLLATASLIAASTTALSANTHAGHPNVVNSPYSSFYGPRTIYLSAPREGVLLNCDPHRGSVRTYTADSGGNPFDTRSPLPYGAAPEDAGDLAIVRTREAVPYMAISPWQPITDRTINELRRNYPWIRRTGSIRQDLIMAQNQYLRERGYVSSIRGFTNQSARAEADRDSGSEPRVYAPPAQTEPDAEPQLIIRESSAEEAARMVRDRLNEESVIRVRSADGSQGED